MSVGIARFPYDGTSLTDILKKADMALYSAKSKGKNQALYYKNKIGTDSIRNIEYERYMRESISNVITSYSIHYTKLYEKNKIVTPPVAMTYTVKRGSFYAFCFSACFCCLY